MSLSGCQWCFLDILNKKTAWKWFSEQKNIRLGVLVTLNLLKLGQ